MQLFSANATVFSKKIKKFSYPENMKKNRPQKLFIIGCPNGPETKAPKCKTGYLDWG